MNSDRFPHRYDSSSPRHILSREGILYKLCNVFRQPAAIFKFSTLTTVISKLYSRKIRSSLFNQLPDEIIIEIFKHYLEEGERIDPVDAPSMITAISYVDSSPILLSYICQNWRRIVMSTPTLWSTIAIHNPRRRHIPLVKFWLDHVGSCPLSISIWHCMDSNSTKHTAIKAILPLLTKKSHLWKFIEFELWDIKVNINLPPGSVPILEYAYINMIDGKAKYNNKIWNLIHSSPRLSGVAWFSGFQSYSTTPWRQLKSIQISFRVPIEELLHSLHFCQTLEVLMINSGVDITSASSTLAGGISSLPSLKVLKFYDFCDSFRYVFDNIQTPELITLDLFSVHPRNFQVFRKFMNKSKCTVELFRLFSPDMTANELLDWLETPGLSSVSYVDISIEPVDLRDALFDIDPAHQNYLSRIVEKIQEFIAE